MLWETKLDRIREGDVPLEIGESGLPRDFINAPYYEQKEFVKALAAGYMRNYNKVRSLRNAVKKEMEAK